MSFPTVYPPPIFQCSVNGPAKNPLRYEDKFGLVERCSVLTLASNWTCFELLGLTLLSLRQLRAAVVFIREQSS